MTIGEEPTNSQKVQELQAALRAKADPQAGAPDRQLSASIRCTTRSIARTCCEPRFGSAG
jgi:hypothetical protein